MLGLFLAAAQIIGVGANEIKHQIEDIDCKKMFVNEDGMTYTDHLGRSRLLSNNHLAEYVTCDKRAMGDYILIDVNTNEIIRNFTEEKRQLALTKTKEELKKNVKPGRTTVKIKNMPPEDSKIKGDRFLDIETGDVYVIRCFGSIMHYVNVKTMRVVRICDFEQKRNISERALELAEQDIKEWGNRKDMINFYYLKSYDSKEELA